MRPDDRRGLQRVGCFSAAAYLNLHRHTVSTLVADVSGNGIQLRGGVDLPPPGTWVSLTISLPPHELDAAGQVAWHDPHRHAIGVHLERGSPRHRHALDAALAVLASEHAQHRSGAMLFVDEPQLAARLCEPLRRHGFIPAAATTPLDAIVRLSRDAPRIELAIIPPRAFGIAAVQLVELLSSEYPEITQIEIPDADAADEELELVLARFA